MLQVCVCKASSRQRVKQHSVRPPTFHANLHSGLFDRVEFNTALYFVSHQLDTIQEEPCEEEVKTEEELSGKATCGQKAAADSGIDESAENLEMQETAEEVRNETSELSASTSYSSCSSECEHDRRTRAGLDGVLEGDELCRILQHNQDTCIKSSESDSHFVLNQNSNRRAASEEEKIRILVNRCV